MALNVELKGLARLQRYFEIAPEAANEAARLALIDVARFARREASKEIREQVNLSRDYLGNDKEGTLTITKTPRAGDLEAVVTGRDRPTSLARYAKGTLQRGSPVKVSVSAGGSASVLQRAFPIRLRRGSAAVTEDNFNQGIAIRLKPGERMTGKSRPLGNTGLTLLYGPSVGQVFRDVSEQISGPAAERLEAEFVRQFERIAGRAT